MSASLRADKTLVSLVVAGEGSPVRRIAPWLKAAGRPRPIAHDELLSAREGANRWGCVVVEVGTANSDGIDAVRAVRHAAPCVALAAVVPRDVGDLVNRVGEHCERVWVCAPDRRCAEAFARRAVALRACRGNRSVASVVGECAEYDGLDAREAELVVHACAAECDGDVCVAMGIGDAWRAKLRTEVLRRTHAGTMEELVNRVLRAVVYGGTAVRPVARVRTASMRGTR